ncbi:protein kinase [bacterium]|nr:protein kinase [bacterium]
MDASSERETEPRPQALEASGAPKRIGPYEVLDRIGHGGAGVVFRAREAGAEGAATVAIKVLTASSEAALLRFERERRLLRSLGSVEGFVPVVDSGTSSHGPYLVMPHLGAGTLRQRLSRGPLPIGEAVGLGISLATAMGRAHALGIVHRDLKPENVLFSDDGRPLVADLGLAKHFRRDLVPGASIDLTADGKFLGTPAYMAPEQMRDSSSVGPHADVYSLGAILYEALAGRPVFDGTPLEVIDRARSGSKRPLEELRAEVPRWLAGVVATALARNEWERFPDARSLASALEARENGAAARPAEERTGEPARRGGTNIPPDATTFVGRRADLEALDGHFARGVRLVTIVGPGGTGKTRLARRYAARHLDACRLEGGAWLCDLAEARDVAGILAAVGCSLEVALTSADTVGQLAMAMAGRGKLLVVLDNFEQLVEHGPATVARWISAAPEARFLVTSREALRLAGEVTHELGPLSLPGDHESRVLESEAVQLFLERARDAPHFRLESADSRVLAEIVRRLDGMPLAIELAAARARVFAPAELLERLDRRFELMTRAPRGTSLRHATLGNAIDWSWNLLAPHEQAALSQIAVFRGGFTVESAEAVLDLSAFPGAPCVPDVVQALCEKSLVRVTGISPATGNLRLRLFESIREYAQEKLEESASAEAAFERHAAHFLALCGAWAAAVHAHGGSQRILCLADERDNLLALHERALSGNAPPERRAREALGAALALEPVYRTRGPLEAFVGVLDSALAVAEGLGADAARARTLLARGEARRLRGLLPEGRADIERALAMASELGDDALELQARHSLALGRMDEGRTDVALEMLEQDLGRARERGLLRVEAKDLHALASLRADVGSATEVRSMLHRALEIFRDIGDRRSEGAVLGTLALVSRSHGRQDDARRELEDALVVAKDSMDRRTEGVILSGLGTAALDEGRLAEARARFAAAREIARETGVRDEWRPLCGEARAYLDERRPDEARRHLESGLAVVLRSGSRYTNAVHRFLLGTVAHAESRFDEARAHYEAALADLPGRSVRSLIVLYRAHLAAADAALGGIDRARVALDEIARDIAPRRDAFEEAMLSILRGSIEADESRVAGTATAREQLLASARTRAREVGAGSPSVASRSSDIRFALWLLELALERAMSPERGKG